VLIKIPPISNYSQYPTTTGLGTSLRTKKQHGMLLANRVGSSPPSESIMGGIMHQEPFLRTLAPAQETRAQRGSESGQARYGNTRWIRLDLHQKGSNGFMWEIVVWRRKAHLFEAAGSKNPHILVRGAAQNRLRNWERQKTNRSDGSKTRGVLYRLPENVLDLRTRQIAKPGFRNAFHAWQAVSIEPRRAGASLHRAPSGRRGVYACGTKTKQGNARRWS